MKAQQQNKEEGVGEDGYVDTWEYSDFNLYYQG